MRTLTCDPTTKVSGQAVLTFVESVQPEDIQRFQIKYNLVTIDPQRWYSGQTLMAMMNEMAQEANLSGNLVGIGISAAERMWLPRELIGATLPDVLYGWGTIYNQQHSSGGNGYIRTDKITDTHYTTSHCTIYPDDYSYGLAYGLARRFLPVSSHFKVKYDANIPTRDNGDDVTIIHLWW